jgi:hypothetical protein
MSSNEVLSEITERPDAMNELANLIAAHTFIGAVGVEFLASNVQRDFAQVLIDLDSLFEAAVRELRDAELG